MSFRASAPGGGGSGGGAGHEFATTQHGLDRNLSGLSGLSELSALPEVDEVEHAGVNGDVSMLSAAPSTDVMPVLGVNSLQINSSQQARPPLERRSKVLARELEAEAGAQASQAAAAAVPSSPFALGRRQAPTVRN